MATAGVRHVTGMTCVCVCVCVLENDARRVHGHAQPRHGHDHRRPALPAAQVRATEDEVSGGESLQGIKSANQCLVSHC